MNFKSSMMDLNMKDGVGYLTFRRLQEFEFVKHAFSTKLGGVSEGEFESMNLGFGRGDKKSNVIENYHRFCDAVGFDFNSLVASSQDHNTYIRCVDEKDKGIGIYRDKDIMSVDGLVTNKKGITLVTYYADCTPIFFVDSVKKVVGLVHAGWRGTVKEIAANMIYNMKNNYGSNAEDVICAIGPAIGKCCYEVDKPVYEQFEKIKDIDKTKIYKEKKGLKYDIDLWETNRQILLKSGVKDENIVVGDICTKCSSELLFSHRATNGKRGTLAAMICIKDI